MLKSTKSLEWIEIWYAIDDGLKRGVQSLHTYRQLLKERCLQEQHYSQHLEQVHEKFRCAAPFDNALPLTLHRSWLSWMEDMGRDVERRRNYIDKMHQEMSVVTDLAVQCDTLREQALKLAESCFHYTEKQLDDLQKLQAKHQRKYENLLQHQQKQSIAPSEKHGREVQKALQEFAEMSFDFYIAKQTVEFAKDHIQNVTLPALIAFAERIHVYRLIHIQHLWISHASEAQNRDGHEQSNETRLILCMQSMAPFQDASLQIQDDLKSFKQLKNDQEIESVSPALDAALSQLDELKKVQGMKQVLQNRLLASIAQLKNLKFQMEVAQALHDSAVLNFVDEPMQYLDVEKVFVVLKRDLAICNQECDLLQSILGEELPLANQVHRFESFKLKLISVQKCDFCQSRFWHAREVQKCSSCGYLCHVSCSRRVPWTCHQTEMDAFNRNEDRAEQSQLDSVESHNDHISSEAATVPSVPILSEPVRMIACYNYEPTENDTVALRPGDQVEVLSQHQDWSLIRHSLTQCEGYVPSSYLKQLENQTLTALYDYSAHTENEISFHTGDKMLLVSEDGDWYHVVFHEQFGLVPKSYVTLAT